MPFLPPSSAPPPIARPPFRLSQTFLLPDWRSSQQGVMVFIKGRLGRRQPETNPCTSAPSVLAGATADRWLLFAPLRQRLLQERPQKKATPVSTHGERERLLDGVPQAFNGLRVPRVVIFCGTYDGKGRHSVSCHKMTEQIRLIQDELGSTQGHVWNQGTEWDMASFKLALSQ